MSKVYMSELNFYLSWTIGHRFGRTLSHSEKRAVERLLKRRKKNCTHELISLLLFFLGVS